MGGSQEQEQNLQALPNKGPEITGQMPTLEPRYPTTRKGWKIFPVKIGQYYIGQYIRGDRLLIGGWSVMEEWERPVQHTTVDKLFERIYGPSKVLIRGEGLGYATDAIIEKLRERGGGELHIIELHPEILKRGKERVESIFRRMLYTVRPEVVWHEGDAFEVTKGMDDDFDVILSDTFPLSEEERDINDVLDAEELVKHLKPSGVFSPFIGQPEGPSAKQLHYISKCFMNYDVTIVHVNPPRDCAYFNGSEMAIVVCKGPRRGNGPAGLNGEPRSRGVILTSS